MKQDLLMGIDIGTQSTRVALLDFEGRVVASSSTLQEMEAPEPGWGEQDPDLWWHNVVAGAGDMMCMLISAGLTEPGRAVDITGTASIISVYVDQPVSDPYTTS